MADLVSLGVEAAIALAGGAVGVLVGQAKMKSDIKALDKRLDDEKLLREQLEEAFETYNNRDREQWNELNRTLGRIEGGLGLR